MQPWGRTIEGFVPCLLTQSIEHLQVASGAAEDKGCPDGGSLTVVSTAAATGSHWCLLQGSALGHKRIESGGRWCWRPSNSQISICFVWLAGEELSTWLVKSALMRPSCVFCSGGCPQDPGPSRGWNVPPLWCATWQHLQ